MAKQQYHDYSNLDEVQPFKVVLPMKEVAEQVVSLNYGSVRFLHKMVQALREKNDKYIKDRNSQYIASGQTDPELLEYQPSKLADGIEALLNQGFYY